MVGLYVPSLLFGQDARYPDVFGVSELHAESGGRTPASYAESDHRSGLGAVSRVAESGVTIADCVAIVRRTEQRSHPVHPVNPIHTPLRRP